jgi:hypothetical protein
LIDVAQRFFDGSVGNRTDNGKLLVIQFRSFSVRFDLDNTCYLKMARLMASDNAKAPFDPADRNPRRICEKCSAVMKQLGELPAMSNHAAIKVFRCYGCDHVVSEPA